MRPFGKIVRSLLLAVVTLSLVVPGGSRGQERVETSQQGQEHVLRLYNTHTGERLEIVFRRGEEYISGALARLDYFLRDHNTGDVRHFDPRLYDILADLTASVGHPNDEIDIVWATALLPRTNRCARTPLESRRTACTFRRKRSTCACRR